MTVTIEQLERAFNFYVTFHGLAAERFTDLSLEQRQVVADIAQVL